MEVIIHAYHVSKEPAARTANSILITIMLYPHFYDKYYESLLRMVLSSASYKRGSGCKA